MKHIWLLILLIRPDEGLNIYLYTVGISSARIHSDSFYNTTPTNTDKTHCYALSHLQDDWNQKVSMYDIEHNTFVRGRHHPFTEKFQSCWSLQFVKLQPLNIAVPSGVSLRKMFLLWKATNWTYLPCLILSI